MVLPETRQEDLSVLRSQIDELDGALLALIRKRMALAGAIAAAKAAAGETSFGLRPVREIAIYRRLLAGIADPVEREAVISVWRTLMAANLRRQGPMSILAADERCAALARAHYGDGADVSVLEPTALFETLGRDRFSIGVLPLGRREQNVDSEPWWANFHAGDLNVVAALPVGGVEGPDAILVAHLAPEQAGSDTTLIVAHGATADAPLKSPLGSPAGPILDRAGKQVLVGLSGFLTREAAVRACEESLGLKSARLVGTFATL